MNDNAVKDSQERQASAYDEIVRRSWHHALDMKVRALVEKGFFDLTSVSEIRRLAQQAGQAGTVYKDSEEVRLLEGLHCMDYQDMNAPLLRMLPVALSRATGLAAERFQAIADKAGGDAGAVVEPIRTIERCSTFGQVVIRNALASLLREPYFDAAVVRNLRDVCKAEGFEQSPDIKRLMTIAEAVNLTRYNDMTPAMNAELRAAVSQITGLPIECVALPAPAAEPSESGTAGGVKAWLCGLFSGRTAKAQLATIATVLRTFHGGIHKRIDENRELLELLRDKAPGLLNEHPWIVGWMESQDGFLNDLLKALPIDNPRENANPARPFPRAWPG